MPLEFLTPTKAKLIDVNTRSEKHGEELHPAIDLRFQLDVGNGVLKAFHPELGESLFKLSSQGQLPGVDKVSDTTELRFPELGMPLRWDAESIDNDLTVDYGIGGESNIQLGDCKVHKHVLTVKAGGTVQVQFTASCAHDLTEQAVGRLGTRVQHDVFIVLKASEAVHQEAA